jgi:hypothetical protein
MIEKNKMFVASAAPLISFELALWASSSCNHGTRHDNHFSTAPPLRSLPDLQRVPGLPAAGPAGRAEHATGVHGGVLQRAVSGGDGACAPLRQRRHGQPLLLIRRLLAGRRELDSDAR